MAQKQVQRDSRSRNKFLRLENLTLLGALLGLVAGLLIPDLVPSVALIGDLFLTLLKMTIVPLILVSVFLAVVAQAGHGQLSKLGLKTLIYFTSTSAVACFTGLMASRLLPTQIQGLAEAPKYDASSLATASFDKILMGFFPANPFKALVNSEIIQIVMFALIMGIASVWVSADKRKILVNGSDAINDLIMAAIKGILYLAPLGLFALVANVIASTKLEAFSGLGSFFLAVAIAALIHTLITLPAFGFFIGKFNPYKFLFNVKEALLVALGTASSSATLPVSTRVMEENEKVSSGTAGFVLPLGATLNMDGSALYQSILVIYLGQVSGLNFTSMQELQIFFFVMISSAGTAGIPGGGLVMMGAMFQMVGIPLEMIGIYLLVDRFWDPIITMINVMGDLFGAKIIDRSMKV